MPPGRGRQLTESTASGRVRTQTKTFGPPTNSKFASASQQARAIQNDKDQNKENEDVPVSDEDVPIRHLAKPPRRKRSKPRRTSTRVVEDDPDEAFDNVQPEIDPDDDGLPRDLALRAQMRDEAEWRSSPPDEPDEYDADHDDQSEENAEPDNHAEQPLTTTGTSIDL